MTAEGLRQHVGWLASDDLEGRNVGTPGLARAAGYLQEKLAESGLTPAGDPRSQDRRRGYEQRFSVEGNPTTNVLATIEGSDPALAGEVVVIGAHFDHLGSARQAHPGRKGAPVGDDSIWNGADDNASGTAVTLAVAQALGAGGVSCRRTLLFAFFSAEEWGLRGSRWYTEHPVAPMAKHRLMLNLDMVGRNPQIGLAVMGAAPSVEALRPRVAAAARQAALPVVVVGMRHVLDNSDHFPFHQRSVPFLFLYSGEHTDYHQVTDHADRLAYDRMTRVARFVARLALDACDAPVGR
ncbi:MAG: M20/M25/M40 family metallo-hydrolase [Myxococcales bacterium]|nr:MAG: M20/M25/M40 family metallo-hydrolase [Myxococcales bacterium]